MNRRDLCKVIIAFVTVLVIALSLSGCEKSPAKNPDAPDITDNNTLASSDVPASDVPAASDEPEVTDITTEITEPTSEESSSEDRVEAVTTIPEEEPEVTATTTTATEPTTVVTTTTPATTTESTTKKTSASTTATTDAEEDDEFVIEDDEEYVIEDDEFVIEDEPDVTTVNPDFTGGEIVWPFQTDSNNSNSSDTNPSTKPSGTVPTPDKMTYEDYMNLDPDSQQAFFDSFASVQDFFAWFNAAKSEYEANDDSIIIDGNGSVDIGDIIGGNG